MQLKGTAERSIGVIWNPAAGSTAAASDVRDALTELQFVRVAETSSREDAIEQVTQFARNGVTRIIAAGGDGTVNAVVSSLMACRGDSLPTPELAVLPLGSGNDLARSL